MQPEPPENKSGMQTVSGVSSPPTTGGIPPFCEYTAESQELSCIVCQQGAINTTKCFETFEEINPNRVCRFTSDEVQCLISRGPKLVKISFSQSDEEEYSRSVLAMTETLKLVADREESLSSSGRKGLLEVILFVEEQHLNMLADGEWVNEFGKLVTRLCKANCQLKEVDRRLASYLSSLRTQRKQGRLSIADTFHFIKDLTTLMVADSQATEVLAKVNVEGLVGH